MSTLPLTPVGPVPSAAAAHRAGASRRAPIALGSALLLLLLYAGFAHGGVSLAAQARMQVALAVIATLAGGAWLWTGELRLAAPRLVLGGGMLLLAFAAWSGISVFWSVAPPQTWIELNRAMTYVLVLVLAVALGASWDHSVTLVVKGFAAIALVVSCYALGQKLLPGLSVEGVFDLNQTGAFPRLQEPLGYWNALALFIALGIPPMLALAVDHTRRAAARLGALVGVELMMVAVGLTYSRGGIIAVVVGFAVWIAVGAARLRSLMWVALICVATAAPLAVGLTDHALTANNVPLGSREGAGVVLLSVLAASMLGLITVARRLQALERRVYIGPQKARGIARLLAWAAGALIVAGLLVVTFSSRGLDGSISHAWNSFTATRATSNTDPARLLSADSENRWVWWKEAAGAFSDRPLVGWGAGSFGTVHLLYRRNTLSVNQPHSVPLQFLAETGLVGALLALTGFGLVLAAATRITRRLPAGPERLFRGALLAAAAMYAVHALYDWDWDIPAVTLPAVAFLGVLVGSARPTRPAETRSGPAVRVLLASALTLAMCLFALSGVLPTLAATKADAAVIAADSGSATSVQAAQASAELASQLNPLSDAGLRVEATIALRRGALVRARALLNEAIDRNPSDAAVWWQLTFVDFSLRQLTEALRATERALALDPSNPHARSLAAVLSDGGTLLETPPAESPTAQPAGG